MRKNYIRKLARKNLIKLILKLKLFNVENSLIIFSEKRGGSTWLLEILSNLDKTIVNWEPLNGIGSAPKKYNLGEKPYLCKNFYSKELKTVFKKILTFNLYSNYTTTFVKINNLISAKYVLTKFVGANMVSEWLLTNFDFKFKPIFLIRNPIDCCSSQLKTFSKWITDDNQLELSNSLNSERFDENMAYLESLNSKLERQIAIWCINNVNTINSNLINKKCIVVYYENLLINTKSEITRILDEIKLPNKSFTRIINYNFKKASHSNFRNDLKQDTTHQLEKNLNSLNLEEKEKIQKIYDHYNFKLYNVFSPFPNNEYKQQNQ